jgi:phenylacetic acid degradation operon negative regulatory protein
MALSPPIAALLKQFHARKPARIWSLIVTLYGDAIVPRGGSLWIGSLIEIMDLFRIDAGHVRTAVSRLSSDGWLASTKRGRASYYRLTKSGEAEFLQATQRIYSGVPEMQGELQVVVIGPKAGDPAGLRAA